ncbi:hypothetical protein [Hymenobacter cellulosilyticus]|uniref:Tetratricopeptide repeat protein n=1 Tax=Hymenobacter cellulosilyticus TaxID=2932248 RepID=A0A8T9Q2G0_9BACT|nr:hypothetical protein [Hymenobacter cellulosilyticus]UOQ71132.1 hypothetical protein MUN79_21070 [Hymenobacter cellulosilyticus]
MTRASLLHILDHVGTISEAEIRELEQLAAAFPYCQTAHVLLAKAAHDQGSMLASQRLRRAATYATDRQLLRHLIEQPAAVLTSAQPEALMPLADPPTAEFHVAETASVEEVASAPVVEPAEQVLVEAGLAVENTSPETASEDSELARTPEAVPVTENPDTGVLDSEADGPELVEANSVLLEEPTSTTNLSSDEAPAGGAEDEFPLPTEEVQAEPETALTNEEAAAVATLDAETVAPVAELVVADESLEPELSVEPASDQEQARGELPADMVVETAGEPADEPDVLLEANPALPSSDQEVIQDEKLPHEILEQAAISPDDDILPAVAPPIRPPIEVGTSRFEFGLGIPEPAEQILYELPVLEEEEPVAAAEMAAGFRGDDHLGYALSGGSRLGFCLQLADELSWALPTTEFFEPDALLQEQTPQYLPPPPPAPSPFDLINKFLRNQPRLRTPAALPASAEEQADLSVRSTQVVPDIASESLAKIMVRQGKIEKAIEIYERLMMRQPEKKAYFAEQIQQLKSTE